MTVCPECAQPRIEPHPAGLVFKHTQTCTLLAAEDATAVADAERLDRWPAGYTRPVTDAERVLLAAAGHHIDEPAADEDPPLTTVDRLTGSVRRRTWEGFENEEDEGYDD